MSLRRKLDVCDKPTGFEELSALLDSDTKAGNLHSQWFGSSSGSQPRGKEEPCKEMEKLQNAGN